MRRLKRITNNIISHHIINVLGCHQINQLTTKVGIQCVMKHFQQLTSEEAQEKTADHENVTSSEPIETIEMTLKRS